jgi:DNA-binding NarL/FixJ family response regulator
LPRPTRRTPPHRSGKGTRILIVETDPLVQYGIAHILGDVPEFDIVGAPDDSRTAM